MSRRRGRRGRWPIAALLLWLPVGAAWGEDASPNPQAKGVQSPATGPATPAAPPATAAEPAASPTPAAATQAPAPAPIPAQAQTPAPAAKPAAPEVPATVTAEPEGFVVQSANGNYRVQTNAILQADGRFFVDDGARLATDSFLLRSARPILQGTVAGRFDIMLAPDFGQGQSLIQDGYLDARFSTKLRLRIGKFKPPVGLERLQSEANLLFVERGLPTDLVPNRDVGLQLGGELGGVFTWAAALTNGVADGASADLATGDARDVSLRGFLRPFRRLGGPLKNLGLGISGSSGRQQGSVLPAYRTPGQVVFFSYASGTVADGHHSRLSPQASFYGGPLAILAEYVRSQQTARKDAKSGAITNDAWQLAASCVLTGELASANGVRPNHPFDPAKGDWGALELAARAHQLRVDQAAYDLGLADLSKSARRATAWSLGLNWYVTRNIKYVLDYEETRFVGGASSGNRQTERILFLRGQIAF